MDCMTRLRDLFGQRRYARLRSVESLVDELCAHGYLRFTPEERRAEARCQLIESAYDGYLDTLWDEDGISLDRRGYPADAEDLADGGVGRTLRAMLPVLHAEGVRLESIEDDLSDTGYRVLLDGVAAPIYDIPDNASQDEWLVSQCRLVGIVNHLLEEADSSERAFGLYCGGNDGRVLLLSRELHSLLLDRRQHFDEDWLPRLCCERGPNP